MTTQNTNYYGIACLEAPTGSGKTTKALKSALFYCITQNRNCIIALPTLSLADQTYNQLINIYEKEKVSSLTGDQTYKDFKNVYIYKHTSSENIEGSDVFKILSKGSSIIITVHSYSYETDLYKNTTKFFELLKAFSFLTTIYIDEFQQILSNCNQTIQYSKAIFLDERNGVTNYFFPNDFEKKYNFVCVHTAKTFNIMPKNSGHKIFDIKMPHEPKDDELQDIQFEIDSFDSITDIDDGLIFKIDLKKEKFHQNLNINLEFKRNLSLAQILNIENFPYVLKSKPLATELRNQHIDSFEFDNEFYEKYIKNLQKIENFNTIHTFFYYYNQIHETAKNTKKAALTHQLIELLENNNFIEDSKVFNEFKEILEYERELINLKKLKNLENSNFPNNSLDSFYKSLGEKFKDYYDFALLTKSFSYVDPFKNPNHALLNALISAKTFHIISNIPQKIQMSVSLSFKENTHLIVETLSQTKQNIFNKSFWEETIDLKNENKFLLKKINAKNSKNDYASSKDDINSNVFKNITPSENFSKNVMILNENLENDELVETFSEIEYKDKNSIQIELPKEDNSSPEELNYFSKVKNKINNSKNKSISLDLTDIKYYKQNQVCQSDLHFFEDRGHSILALEANMKLMSASIPHTGYNHYKNCIYQKAKALSINPPMISRQKSILKMGQMDRIIVVNSEVSSFSSSNKMGLYFFKQFGKLFNDNFIKNKIEQDQNFALFGIPSIKKTKEFIKTFKLKTYFSWIEASEEKQTLISSTHTSSGLDSLKSGIQMLSVWGGGSIGLNFDRHNCVFLCTENYIPNKEKYQCTNIHNKIGFLPPEIKIKHNALIQISGRIARKSKKEIEGEWLIV